MPNVALLVSMLPVIKPPIMNSIPPIAKGAKKPKAINSANTSTSGFDFTYLVTAGINPLNLKFDIFVYLFIVS